MPESVQLQAVSRKGPPQGTSGVIWQPPKKYQLQKIEGNLWRGCPRQARVRNCPKGGSEMRRDSEALKLCYLICYSWNILKSMLLPLIFCYLSWMGMEGTKLNLSSQKQVPDPGISPPENLTHESPSLMAWRRKENKHFYSKTARVECGPWITCI